MLFLDFSRLIVIDLFYCRESDQKKIDALFALNDPSVLDFFCKQLSLSQRAMEYLKPKVIVVCNRGAGKFFGKDKIEKNGVNENVWMGYCFEENKIIENIHPQSISWEVIKKTELKGTSVIFERSFRHMSGIGIEELEKKIANKIKADLSDIA